MFSSSLGDGAGAGDDAAGRQPRENGRQPHLPGAGRGRRIWPWGVGGGWLGGGAVVGGIFFFWESVVASLVGHYKKLSYVKL